MDVRSILLLPIIIFSLFMQNTYASLKYQEAEHRSKQVYNVEYNIDLDLSNAGYNDTEDSKTVPSLPLYKGKVQISFDLYPESNNISSELFLDFTSQNDAKLQSIYANGKVVNARWDKADGKIFIPLSALTINNRNKIEIEFLNRFTRKGHGFHRSVDKSDNEIYIYTNLEPYYANEVFPLFDQPDLKASFTLQSTVPNEWQVVSNTREIRKTSINANLTTWTFDKSAQFSSYLFFIAAGPFHVWESDKADGIPMRLFARKTLAKYVNSEDWFNITANLLATYQLNFGQYPFGKYDQILVPETASGAMENVAAVSFNEAYISRSPMTESQRLALASVIAHEMAHMWFGDLVTMKWWDDLWLNESFATFSSGLFTDELQSKLNFTGSWEYFFIRNKVWGYEEDNYKTTHPIVGNVQDTKTALANFDGITYGKGASTLKQLFYYIGRENFMKGLRAYFDKYSYKNATRQDFLDELSNVTGLDLNAWSNEWLENSGTNVVQLSMHKVNDKVQKLLLTPKADPIESKYRTHKTQVGLYNFNPTGKIVLQKTIPVTYSTEPVDITAQVGDINPLLVFANTSDYDFAIELFNEQQIELLKLYLSKIEDNLLKQQIYFSLWTMLQNNQINVLDFIDLLLTSSLDEKNTLVMRDVSLYLKRSLRYVSINKRSEINQKISDFLLKKLTLTTPKSDLQKDIFATFVSNARSSKHTSLMLDWLSNNQKIDGLELTQDQRWLLIQALAYNNYESIQSIIEKELSADNTNLGHLSANVARIKVPTIENKQRWLDNLSIPGKINSSDTRIISPYFNDVTNPQLTEFMENKYVDTLLELIAKNEDDTKIAILASNLYPVSISKSFITKTDEFLSTHNQLLTPKVKRVISNRIEDSIRILNTW